ncbi:MAG: hypothetical protein AEth_00139 [Candidatus Argoarchaeum ethanivorans]|uniref:Uncharacterized protein n=1 Tax=Candidatus Argoarchaeum ethanivorans TaxID=2608793 RepID=A0A8B3S471_9EURY|nr:MAG: hypothetical protein AEth_00139 [Candidatus Argoarchaeum ethanivorans]
MHMQKQYKHDSELHNFAFAEPHTPCAGMPATLDYEAIELCKQSRGGDINGTNRYK